MQPLARLATVALAAASLGAGLPPSISAGPAPDGDPAVVAQKVISANFDQNVCSLVVGAKRFGDGSIRATCNNGESFRVFSVTNIGPVALRCSAAAKEGIEGC